MATKLRIIVPPHPLIAHWLTMLRNTKTPEPLYATALEELGKWLSYEALRDWLPHRTEEIDTENGKISGQVIENNVPLMSIPFGAGGFELWQGARLVLPNSHLCLQGIPDIINQNAGLLIFVGQISNGKNLLNILQDLKSKHVEPQRIRVLTAIACNDGLKYIGENIPNLNIYCACIDPELSENDEILPGIGNPSLRLSTRITCPH